MRKCTLCLAFPAVHNIAQIDKPWIHFHFVIKSCWLGPVRITVVLKCGHLLGWAPGNYISQRRALVRLVARTTLHQCILPPSHQPWQCHVESKWKLYPSVRVEREPLDPTGCMSSICKYAKVLVKNEIFNLLYLNRHNSPTIENL